MSTAATPMVDASPPKSRGILDVATTDPAKWYVSTEKREPGANTAWKTLVIPENENTTVAISERDREVLASSFKSLFRSARETLFEDGMETEFSRSLVSLVQVSGPASRHVLAELFKDRAISPGVVSEALRWLGRMDDEATYEARLWLLENALASHYPMVRDGATLGLASMDDPRAARYLELAIKAEVQSNLRHDMEDVLDQLTNGH